MILQEENNHKRHKGSGKWIAHRISLVFFLGFSLWFLSVVVADLRTASSAEILDWLCVPKNALLLLAIVLIGLYHFGLEMHDIIEDYIHHPANKKLVKGCISIFLGALAGLFAYVIMVALKMI